MRAERSAAPSIACLIRFTPEQKRRLDELAKADDRSLAYVIRKAVDCYIARQEASDAS